MISVRICHENNQLRTGDPVKAVTSSRRRLKTECYDMQEEELIAKTEMGARPFPAVLPSSVPPEGPYSESARFLSWIASFRSIRPFLTRLLQVYIVREFPTNAESFDTFLESVYWLSNSVAPSTCP